MTVLDVPAATEPDLDDTEDGLEVTWGSGHVSGPFDADELALLRDRGALEDTGDAS